MITVSELNEGQWFKLTNQRHWRIAGKIIHNLTAPNLGKSLVCFYLNGKCCQYVLDPSLNIFVQNY